MATSTAVGLGEFFRTLGGHGMAIGKEFSRMREREAEERRNEPIRKLNLQMLQDAAKRSKIGLEREDIDLKKKKQAQKDVKTLKKLLSKLAVQEELAKIGAESQQQGAQPGTIQQEPIMQPQKTAKPTTEEQMQRIKGTEFEFSQQPEIKGMVSDVRERFQEEQAPILEQQKFERELEGRKELESYKSDLKIREEIMRKSIEENIETTGFSDNEKKDAYKFINRTDKDKTLQMINRALSASTTIRDLVGSDSKLAPSVIEVQMPKMMGEVGNLAQQEQTKWRGSQAWLDRAKRAVKKAATGKMTQEDMNVVFSLLDEFENTGAKLGIDRVNLIEEQSLAISGMDKERFNNVSAPIKENYENYLKKVAKPKQNTFGRFIVEEVE
jgi:hypothetical protein